MINMRSSRAVSNDDSRQGLHTQGCLGRHSLPNLLSGRPILTPNLTPLPCSPLYHFFPSSLSWFSPFSPKQMKVVIS